MNIKSLTAMIVISAVSISAAGGLIIFGNGTYYSVASLNNNQLAAGAGSISIPHTVESGWCTCPYYVLFIGGTRSVQGDDEDVWIRRNFPASQQHYLSLDNPNGDLSAAKIKQIYTTVLNQVNSHHRVLIVAHSLGSSVAQNVVTKINSDCVDLIPVDPPLWSTFGSALNSLFGKFMASIFRNDATQIILAEENSITSNPDYINWTNGTTKTQPGVTLLHSPFGLETPEALLQLDDLKNTINHKIDSCQLKVTIHVLKADGTVAGGDVVTLKYKDAAASAESLYQSTDTSGNATFSDLSPYVRQVPASTVQAATLDDSNAQSDLTPIPIKDGEKVTLKLKSSKSQCIIFQASAPEWKSIRNYYASSQPITTLSPGNYVLNYVGGAYDTPNVNGNDVYWVTGFQSGLSSSGNSLWSAGSVINNVLPGQIPPATLLENSYSSTDHPLFFPDTTLNRTVGQIESADKVGVQDRFKITVNTPIYYELDVDGIGYSSLSHTFAAGDGFPKFKICPDTSNGSINNNPVGNPLIIRPINSISLPATSSPISAKVGVFRNSDGTWSLDQNGDEKYDNGDLVLSYGGHGSPADFPLIGDWNGDKIQEIGVFHAQNHQFVLDTNASGSYEGADADFTLAVPGTSGNLKPVIGDWNGSGTTKVGLYDQNNGTFYLDYNGNSVWDGTAGGDKIISGFKFIAGDTWYPLAGDWNGIGKISVGSYDMSTGSFYLDSNNDGIFGGTDTTLHTTPGLPPLYADANNDGKTDVGVYDSSTGTFTIYINSSATTISSWGIAGDQPVIYNNLIQKLVLVNEPPISPSPSGTP